MSRKQALHLIKVNYNGITDKIKKTKKKKSSHNVRSKNDHRTA